MFLGITSTKFDIRSSVPLRLSGYGRSGGLRSFANHHIGSEQVPELLSNLPETIRSRVRKAKRNSVFRFGNHQTLQSNLALMMPLQDGWLRMAIVKGRTPFLLSNHCLKKTLKAVIDTDLVTLWSKNLNRYLEITETS